MAKQKIRETHTGVFQVQADGTLKLHSSYASDAAALESSAEEELQAYVLMTVHVLTELEVTTTVSRPLPAILPGEKVEKGGKAK